MSEFFNTKEDVIDVQLTAKGRELLSAGKWRPAFYSFHDDDILYDGLYAGVTEEQNSVETRVEGTPRKRISSHEPLSLPMGNSSQMADYAPAWSLVVSEGDLDETGTLAYFDKPDNKTKYNVNIPQIEVNELGYKTKLSTAESLGDESIVAGIAAGGEETLIELVPENLQFSVMEENTDGGGRYSLELFEVEEFTGISGETLETLRKIGADEINDLFEVLVDAEIGGGGEIILDSSLGVYKDKEEQDVCVI